MKSSKAYMWLRSVSLDISLDIETFATYAGQDSIVESSPVADGETAVTCVI